MEEVRTSRSLGHEHNTDLKTRTRCQANLQWLENNNGQHPAFSFPASQPGRAKVFERWSGLFPPCPPSAWDQLSEF